MIFMRIRNAQELERLEKRIKIQMRRYEVDDILLGLRNTPRSVQDKLQPFMIAGTALFAIRYALCPAQIKSSKRPLHWNQLGPLINLVNNYLLAEPVSFEPPIENEYHGSVIIPIFLRIAANQFSYIDNHFGQNARTLKLLHNIPKKVNSISKTKKFDIEAKFSALNGVSLVDFIDVGTVILAASISSGAFMGAYFQKAREQGMNLPDDKIIESVVDQFARDLDQIKEMYEQYKQPDRNYAAYDFNPLRVFPVVRPWKKGSATNFSEERLIVPLPQLVSTKMSEGVYAQMFHAYKSDFAGYFGLLFENYIGEILENSFSAENIYSEDMIRKTYKSEKGKAPDWVVFENEAAILIECKATGLSQKALATGDMESVDYSVKQVIKGLVQLHEFKHACQKKTLGLEKLHNYSELKLLLTTYEPFYLINSDPFRETINQRLENILSPKGITVSNYEILSVVQLEKLQPHLAASVKIRNILDDLKSQTFDKVIENCHSQTKKTYKDCFLYKMDEEIYGRLNVML